MNNCCTLSFLMHELFVRFVNHRLVHLMNNVLVTLMDYWLMNLTHLFFIDDRLMMLMNYRLMMLMDDILVVLMDNISMVFMDYISMRFLNNSCICLCHYSWSNCVRFNHCLLDVSSYQNWLFMTDNCSCHICVLNYRGRSCLNQLSLSSMCMGVHWFLLLNKSSLNWLLMHCSLDKRDLLLLGGCLSSNILLLMLMLMRDSTSNI